jgi:hypothetical protein
VTPIASRRYSSIWKPDSRVFKLIGGCSSGASPCPRAAPPRPRPVTSRATRYWSAGGPVSTSQAFPGANLDDCIGAKPETTGLDRELLLSARKQTFRCGLFCTFWFPVRRLKVPRYALENYLLRDLGNLALKHCCT